MYTSSTCGDVIRHTSEWQSGEGSFCYGDYLFEGVKHTFCLYQLTAIIVGSFTYE